MSYAGAFASAAAAFAASNEAVAASRDVAAKFPPISKCPSCGSREWVAHDGKEVCAYCRGDRGVAVERPIPRAGFGNDPGPY